MKSRINASRFHDGRPCSNQMTEPLRKCHKGRIAGIAMVAILASIVAPTMSAQTYTVLHSFSGPDGANPIAGLTIDRGGNLYGTTANGGNDCDGPADCGTVFRVQKRGSNWIFASLYRFEPSTNGFGPDSRVFIGPDGSLYGTTVADRRPGCIGYGNDGCGVVYRLRPSPRPCLTALCTWTETVVHSFQGGSSDGYSPSGDLAFDSAGNIYGTTQLGHGTSCGGPGCGTVYKLTPAGGGWTESVLYAFTGGLDGDWPPNGIVEGSSGELYGASVGAPSPSACMSHVFQLSPSGSGWSEQTIFTFPGDFSDGCYPGGLILDGAGNLYGMTPIGGPGGLGQSSGTVFQLTPSGSSWNLNTTYTLNSGNGYTAGTLAQDSNGNLYGAIPGIGAYRQGEVFKLTPTPAGWAYTDLHDFNGDDGANLLYGGAVVLDAQGNLYGTTESGGPHNAGVIWEITP